MKRKHFINAFIFLLLYPFIIWSYWWLKVWINTDQKLSFSKIIFAPYLLPYNLLMSHENLVSIVSNKSHRYILASLLIAIHLLLFHFLIKLFKFRFPLSLKKEKALYDLNFFQNGRSLENTGQRVKLINLRAPKITINREEIIIDTPNFAKNLDQVVADKLSLESIFNCEIVDIKRVPHSSKNIFKLKKSQFDSMNANVIPTLMPFQLYLGLNATAEAIKINLKTNFSTFIAARSGKGKTTLIKNYIRILKADSPNLKVVIFDFKLIDYDDEFLKEYDIQFFPMTNLDEIKAANMFFDDLALKAVENAKLLKEHKVSHAEDLHEQNIPTALPRMLLLLDEASKYLKENGSKEVKDEKKKLIVNVENALSYLRAHSCSIIVSSQGMTKDSLDIGYENFTTLILSTVGKEMSDKYAEGFARENKLGEWYVRNDDFSCLIKVPYTIKQMR